MRECVKTARKNIANREETWSTLVTIVVSDEEPEAHGRRERPRSRHYLEDDLECDQIDNYGPRRREGRIMRRDKRGGFVGSKLRVRPSYVLVFMMWCSLLSSLAAIERLIQRILCGAGASYLRG